MNRRELGERIRELRKSQHFTREELAIKSGLSSKFIYEVENGKKGLSVDSLMKIAKGLSCTCDEILVGKETEAKRVSKLVDMLSELEYRDVEYVTQVLVMMKDMHDK